MRTSSATTTCRPASPTSSASSGAHAAAISSRCVERTILACLLALAGCGQRNSGDPKDPGPVTGPDAFLLFPNPLVRADGTLEMNSADYARAYYAAVDPNGDKDTLAKWRAANGFDSGSGTQVTVVFGDVRDLGYGRRMTARQNVDGTIAFVVENYRSSPATAMSD